jgi:hypothetical protein
VVDNLVVVGLDLALQPTTPKVESVYVLGFLVLVPANLLT